MTKRSVKERYLQQQKHRYVKWRNRIKPPYTCPICHLPNVVQVKKEKLEIVEETANGKRTNTLLRFTVSCQRGCFSKSIEHQSELYEPVDAYCTVVDKLRHDSSG